MFRGERAPGQQPSRPGSVERLLTLNVNGQDRRVDVMKQETLAMTLRYKLGLTGTKLGCDRSECGACTVLVDDVPALFVLGADALGARQEDRDDRRAGGADGTLHPVQQGVVSEQGFQCAFCMPGFVMAAAGYPEDESEPDARRAGARGLRQSVPVPGLRQDPHRPDEAVLRTCGGVRADNMPTKLVGTELHDPRPRREGDGQGEVRGRLPRRGDAVREAAVQPDAARAGDAHRHERGAGDAGRQGDPHGRRSAGAAEGRQPG